MVKPGLVPTHTHESCGLPNPSSPLPDIVTSPEGQTHPLVLEGHFPLAAWPVSRNPSAQRELLVSSGSHGDLRSTESSYSSVWQQWDCWCFTRDIDLLSAPLSSILEFLLEQFHMGKQYRTINSLRSAISMTHLEVDGSRVGQHPLVSRFLKGVFNSRPPAPKYSSTWDVDIVLDYIKRVTRQ